MEDFRWGTAQRKGKWTYGEGLPGRGVGAGSGRKREWGFLTKCYAQIAHKEAQHMQPIWLLGME